MEKSHSVVAQVKRLHWKYLLILSYPILTLHWTFSLYYILSSSGVPTLPFFRCPPVHVNTLKSSRFSVLQLFLFLRCDDKEMEESPQDSSIIAQLSIFTPGNRKEKSTIIWQHMISTGADATMLKIKYKN